MSVLREEDRVGFSLGDTVASFGMVGTVFDSGKMGLCCSCTTGGGLLLSDGLVIWLGHCGIVTKGCKGWGVENEDCIGRLYIESS